MQKSTKDTTLDIGEDRLVLSVNPDKYHLDLDLSFDVDNETSGAQYNRKTKVMDICLRSTTLNIFPYFVRQKSSNFRKHLKCLFLKQGHCCSENVFCNFFCSN